ncbi:hypothetical protein ACTFIY_002100 [Dictyostelium cf. discoideum]
MIINDEELSKEPLLNKNGVGDEIKVKSSLNFLLLRKHKYFKQLLLIYLFYTLAILFHMLPISYFDLYLEFYQINMVENQIYVVACIITTKTNCLYYFYVSHTFAGISNAAAIFSFLKGIGVITGPLIFIGLSSLSLSSSSSYIILLVAGGLMILCISIIPFLKESTEIAKLERKVNTNNSNNQTLNPFKLIKNLFSNSPFISFVILIYVLMSFSSEDVNTSYYYYSELMYNWGSKENGLYLGCQGVFIIIWGVLIIPILLKYFSPRKTVSIGIGVGIIAHICLVFSGYSKYLWILGSALNSNGTNNLSLIQSIVSNSIPYSLQRYNYNRYPGNWVNGNFFSFLNFRKYLFIE